MTQGNQGYGQQPGQYGPQYDQGPSYASPQYGPGSYGQPAGGAPGGRERSVGVTGLILAVVGAAAVVVAFTVMDWIKMSSIGFSNLHDLASASDDSAPTVSALYFGWLAWVALGAAFVLAILAVLPTGASAAMRVLGLLVGLGAAVLTLFAIKGDGSFSSTFDNVDAGFFVATAGFVVIGIGAVTGPRKVR